MAEKETKFIMMQCDHCGKRTTFALRVEYMHTDRAEVASEKRNYGNKVIYTYRTWQIVQCLECSKPTMTQIYRVSSSYDSSADPIPKTEILYPVDKLPLSNLPGAIEKAYMAALKVRYEPNACAVLVGRTLEVVCAHEHVPGRVLAERLKNLANSGRIPQTLAEMAQQLRLLRNLGAHDDDNDEVTEEDVPIILDFLEAILEYLYVAPAKIAAVQARLDRTS